MMGDDMAIRSGGMYGNPESSYTLARPSGSFGGFGMSALGKMVRLGMGITANVANYRAEKAQIATDLYTLQKEREYNLKNFEQNIADTFARNKMSFYASGLDFTGTAKSVALANRNALYEDMSMMEYNYNMQERSLKQKQKAARGNLVGNIASSVLSIF